MRSRGDVTRCDLILMNPLFVLCIGMALVNFYVGSYYLYFYARRPQVREHLPFGLLCISVGLYDVFAAGLYNSQSIADGIRWQKLQLDTVNVISVFMLWFTSVFTQQVGNRIVRYSIVWLIVVALVALVAGPEFTVSVTKPAVKDILLLNRFEVTYYEGVVGLVYQLEIASALVIYLYLFYLFIRHYQSTQRRVLAFVFAAFIVYFVAVVNDTLVAMQLYPFVYISEYSFFIIILVMAYILLDKFVGLHIAFEELNMNLERKIDERTREINELNGHLKYLVDRDGLTGAYNRRFFNELLKVEVRRATSFLEHKAQRVPNQDSEMSLGLAMIDIDHFKQINDTHGHLVGDAILKLVVGCIQSNIFARDVLCRYGGDEFALLLTNTNPEGSLSAVEKIRREIAGHEFQIGQDQVGRHVTISIGLVIFNEVLHQGAEEIVRLADDRLLRAKRQGRNRIVCDEEIQSLAIDLAPTDSRAGRGQGTDERL